MARPLALAAAAVAVALVAAAPLGARASAGNEDPAYQQCVRHCTQEVVPSPLPLSLRALQWSWEDNCRYDCMQRIVQQRLDRGLPVLQYHGKWPFVRVAGIQEPASVLFSLLNLGAYLVGFPAFWAAIKNDDFFGKMWLGYVACGMNAWIWSSIFHARDVLFTERMDYFSAGLLNFYGCYCAIIRVFQVRDRAWRSLLAVLFATLYASHVAYLSLVTFDYGWNMLVNIAVSAVAGLLWIGWAVVQREPHAWRAVVTVAALSAAMSLELLDFPPLWWTLDAHALWHAATVPTMLMWYRFLTADSLSRRNKLD